MNKSNFEKKVETGASGGIGASSAGSSPMADFLSREVNENDHIQGNDSAAVSILMYGAYECPHCVEGNKIVKQLHGNFRDDLRLVFRHFPRTDVHPHAEAAAEVAEAAGEQNKFWEMHDMLFENYNRLDVEHLIGYAEALRLDMERFDRAIAGRVFAERVREDLISGLDSGVRGTPSYFINGLKHRGSGQYETLVEAIEISIAQAMITEDSKELSGDP